MRYSVRFASAAALVFALGCDAPTAVHTETGTNVELQIGAAAAASIDELRITLRQAGQADQNDQQSVSGPGSYNFNFTNLQPGTWEIFVRGVQGGEIEFFGTGTTIITADQSTSTTVSATNFVPRIVAGGGAGGSFSVTWPAIPGAASYEASASIDGFATSFPASGIDAGGGTVTATFTTTTVGTFGVRARALPDQVPETGRPGFGFGVVFTDFVTTGSSFSGDLTPTTPLLLYAYDAFPGEGIMAFADGGGTDLSLSFGPPGGARIGGDLDVGVRGDPTVEWIVGVTPPSFAPAGATANPDLQTLRVTSPTLGTGTVNIDLQQCRVISAAQDDGGVFDALDATDCLTPNFISSQVTHAAIITFDGRVGEEVTVDLIGDADPLTSFFDPTLFLFDADGVLVEFNDDGGTLLNSRIITTLPTDQRYIAFVSTFTGGEVGDFDLFVESGVPIDFNTTVTSDTKAMTGDGFTTANITVRVIDRYGNNVPFGVDDVEMSTDFGSLSSVVDNGDGTYSAVLTSEAFEETGSVFAKVNGSPTADFAAVDYLRPGDVIVDGSFSHETGTWASNSVNAFTTVTFGHPNSAPGYALLGVDPATGDGVDNVVGASLRQDVFVVDPSMVQVAYNYNVTTAETSTTDEFDGLDVLIHGDGTTFILCFVAGCANSVSNLDADAVGVYSGAFADLSFLTNPNQTVGVEFLVDTDVSNPTEFRIDNVSVAPPLAAPPPAAPGGTAEMRVGHFEPYDPVTRASIYAPAPTAAPVIKIR